MTTFYCRIPVDDERMPQLETERDTQAESAYEEYWHAMEDDVGVADFDDDLIDHKMDDDMRDVYFSYVSAIEA